MSVENSGGAAAPPHRIHTIPAGRPFLQSLAQALLDGHLPVADGPKPDSLNLTDVTLFLPTRRATRALQEAFLKAGRGRAMLLPTIRPISEGDEDLSLLSAIAASGDHPGSDIRPAIPTMQRRLVLTQLIQRWSEQMQAAQDASGIDLPVAMNAATPAQAALLAADLARLMDMIETEGADIRALSRLVPERYSGHWQKTLDFLKIITGFWPEYLEASGQLSPANRRNALIRAEAERLRTAPPKGPVIVAGVTGSIPATVDLMRTVAALPNGALVLPALDLDLDDEGWHAIAPEPPGLPHAEHPQHGLAKLLRSLGIERSDVRVLKGCDPSEQQAARHRLISEALRPSRTTHLWHDHVHRFADEETRQAALEGMELIEAPSEQDEAETIALILRHAAETPGRTAALVSPDRLLARRIAIRLESWGIRVDDSAGRPLAKTVPGAFLELVIAAFTDDFEHATLMALLKHPLTRLGRDPFAIRRAARALEIAALRTVYIGTGLEGIAAALTEAQLAPERGSRQHPAVQRLWPEDWAAAHDLVENLKTAFAPLFELASCDGPHGLAMLARAHVSVAENLARVPAGADPAVPQPSPIWKDAAGEAAHTFFIEIMDDTADLDVDVRDYADLYRTLSTGSNVRPLIPVHPRLFIWGPFEARLQQTDVMILGSLNDGAWPETADAGPWINRPMRTELSLPSPEETIGLYAHDFVSLLGAPQVYLTRSQRADGVPTVASRWLLRLQALLDGTGAKDALRSKEPWLAWARQRDVIRSTEPVSCPEPAPPVSLRPRKLSVSRAETFFSNPYAIFAKDILGLHPLNRLGTEPGHAERGSLIHEVLAGFARAYPKELPEDLESQIVTRGLALLGKYRAHPRITAFWIPRFQRFAEWFAATEPARRMGLVESVAETTGRLVFEAPAGPFTLTARADRIDVMDEGLIITDYKTGTPPKPDKVAKGFAPQLPLEAAIAAEKMFALVPGRPVVALRYIRASGGTPAGEQSDLTEDIGGLTARVLEGFKRHVARFDNPATPYKALRRPGFSYHFDDYEHLARVTEWSATDRDDTGEAEE